MFTSVVVVEVAEVTGAGDGDHLSDAGRRPTRDGLPHAWAACKPSRGETIAQRLTGQRSKRLVSSSLRANQSITQIHSLLGLH